jgi:dihydroorotase
MNPPIRDVSHTEALWNALKRGVPDVIGSDHAPHTIEEKSKDYPLSPSGMPGVQTLVPVMLTHVINGKMDLKQFVDMTTKNVAKIFGLEELGEIAVGKRASLSFIDMNTERKITNEWMENKSGWTPFFDFTAKAWPIHTMVGGEFSMFNEKLQKHNQCKEVRFKHNRL